MPFPVMISIIVALGVICFIVAGLTIYREYAGSRSLDERLGRLAGTTVQVAETPNLLREPMLAANASSLIESNLRGFRA